MRFQESVSRKCRPKIQGSFGPLAIFQPAKSTFDVTIAKRHVPHFISAGLSPQSLSGRTVRVRGFIEERAGPWIEAIRPGQFEIVGPSAGGR